MPEFGPNGIMGGVTRPRQGQWNSLGLWSLYWREVKRFFKIYLQTFVAPVVTALLFLSIFNFAFEGDGRSMGNVPFTEFLVPGLSLMALLTASFAGTSFSIMFEKLVETIVDSLMPPLSPFEHTAGYTLAATTRGLLVGLAVILGMSIFVPVQIHSWPFILFHAFAAALALSLLGLITSIWAEKVDHVASITNFVIMPLSFLSGTFYSIKYLPDTFQIVAQFNPFFYMIDGFRYGFLGHADGSLVTGIVVMVVLVIVLWAFCQYLFACGYKLKS